MENAIEAFLPLIDGECNWGISHAHMYNLSHEKNLSIRKSKSHSWLWQDLMEEEGGKNVLEVVQHNSLSEDRKIGEKDGEEEKWKKASF